MKEIFGINIDLQDLSEDDHAYDGCELASMITDRTTVEKIDDLSLELLDASIDAEYNMTGTIGSMKWPAFIVSVLGIICVAGDLIKGLSFSDILRTSLIPVLLIPAGIIAGLVLHHISRSRKKLDTDNSRFEKAQEEYSRTVNSVITVSGCPLYAPRIDFMEYTYETENGVNSAGPFFTNRCGIQFDDEIIYIYSVYFRIEIEKFDLLQISRIDCDEYVDDWYFDELPDEEFCRAYDFELCSYGTIHIHHYYTLTARINGEIYCLRFLPYEIEKVIELTGLDVYNA